ncbi:phosphatidylcholine/phosphatidylserine synthase [Sandarakinorhabdus sp.]|uniref:CDP-alcohol phosphatidyltransferase family protein n=1 Tax=Sandarakinorhabdus sp. TaxID=1916663 RepID=UPI00286DEB28|nr:phosphatidylcholine/phosphatidylserine synthase [Sandarakinorhabdus sp.]
MSLHDVPVPGRRRFGIPLRAVIPNAVTILALCAGLTGVRFAIGGEWEKAVAAVVAAGVLDGIDGRIARLLKASSRFGAELDSLSDVTAFGVAPTLIIYLWALQYLPGVGWVIALAHAVTCALRLARFNAQIDAEEQPHKRLGYLTGIPAPVAAGISLSPMFLTFWLEPAFMDNLEVRATIAAAVVIPVAFLMVSSLPTFSWGSIRLRPAWRLPALAGVGLFAGSLFTTPWMTLTLISLAYAGAVPLAWRSYARMKAREGAAQAGPEADA